MGKRDPKQPKPKRPVYPALARRWVDARKSYWAETRSKCDECLEDQKTGDVVFVYGDLQDPEAKRFYLCTRCGYQVLQSGNFPTATVLFVEDHYLAAQLAELKDEEILHVEEGFGVIDEFHKAVAGLMKKYPALTGEPN